VPTLVLREKATELSVNKQRVEAQLAKSLYEYFNKGEALRNLQTLAGRLLSGMLYGVANAQILFDYAAEEEGGLEVWTKINGKTWQAADAFYKRNGESTLNASEVSDLIRLFGAWVEWDNNPAKVKGRLEAPNVGLARPGLTGNMTSAWGQNLTNSAGTKEAYRTGVPGNKGPWSPQEVESVWSDKKDRFKDVPGARRDRGDGWAIEEYIREYMRNPTGFSGMAGVAANQKGSKRAKGDSNVLKIDRLFGLIVGCDISGTTTDTAFALETQGGDIKGLTAAYYMLPLATIVYQNHHSLIEVALALSLNGILDYHVGWYTTLKPTSIKSTIAALSKEFAGVDSLLDAAERDPRNDFFMCFYSRSGALQGAYVFTLEEARKLKAANVFRGIELLRKAPGMPYAPTDSDLNALIAPAGISFTPLTTGRL